MKKIVAFAVSAIMAVTGLCGSASPIKNNDDAVYAESNYNYGEALQKSMFFYEVQQAGILPNWNEVTWRDDSFENDVVAGGWFDAGDHLKFALTNAYSATLLGWGLIEYRDAVKKSGLEELYLNNLKWGLDYVVGCDLGDEIVYMIGEGAFDHVWWGSAEVYMRKYILKGGEDPRPYYTCKDSCIEAQMACALATGYILFKDSDPALAEKYLDHAKDLFKRADAEKIIGEDTAEHSYYKPTTFYDDLLFAANWLYKATGEQSYLDKAESYIPNLGKEEQSTEMKFSWGHCWDDTMQGALLLYAQNTGEAQWSEQVKKHLEYWTTGYGGKRVQYTPDGLAWLFQWGSLRHATTTAFLAEVASDTIFKDNADLSKKYKDWAKSQMDYCFGDNDLGMSYVLGMGDKNPKSFHHRTASGVHDDHWNELGTDTESEQWQTEYAHILYGALEGGPNQDGTFTDQIASYQNTEVAIDYNAGFTAALCGMIEDYGGEPLADFPPTETPKWAEFLVKASINQASSSYTEIKAYAMNHSAWPARVIKDLSYNYYFDITELVDAGYSISDVKVQKGTDQHSGDEGAATVSDPIHYKGNIYYVKISLGDGRIVMPTGQSEHRSELQFRIGISDTIQNVWDPSNDYSFKDLVQGGEDAMIETPYITMYDGDKLIWGTEPDGKTPDDYTESSGGKTLVGDVNNDGSVTTADYVLLCKYIVKEPSAKITKQGSSNADIDENSLLNIFDSILLKRILIK